MDNWGVIAASIVAILAVLVALAVVDARMLPAAGRTRSLLLSLAFAATGVVVWLLLAPLVAPGVVGPLFLPIAGLAGVAAYLSTIVVRATGGTVVTTAVFGILWSTLVFVPVAVLTFTPFAATWPVVVSPVDHGGSLVMNVASGAAALGALLAARKRGTRTATIGLGAGVIGTAVLCLGWLGWLASVELAIDGATGAILLNGVIGALAGAVGWLAVQRLRHQSTSLAALAAGLVSGLVSVTAGAPLLTPIAAGVAGILAGAGACLFTLQRVMASRRQQWFIVGSHLIAGAIGIVTIGLLATGMGYFYTGDTGVTFTGVFSLLERQVISTVLVAAYSTAVSFVLWCALKRVSRDRAVTVAVPA